MPVVLANPWPPVHPQSARDPWIIMASGQRIGSRLQGDLPMQAKTILFPTDFSHAGDAALEYAASLARDSAGKLIIAHVEEPLPAYIGEGYYGVPNPPNPEARRMREAIKPPAAVNVEQRLLLGEPAEEIVRFAKEENVDMIVMGTHGRTGFSRLLLGSVTEQIVRRAPCPLLTIKEPKHVTAGQ